MEEVANLCAYLALRLAHFVNGTMIESDGGQQKASMDITMRTDRADVVEIPTTISPAAAEDVTQLLTNL